MSLLRKRPHLAIHRSSVGRLRGMRVRVQPRWHASSAEVELRGDPPRPPAALSLVI